MPGACQELGRGALAPVADLKNATYTARLQAKLQFLAVRKPALVQIHPELSEALNLRREIANVPRKREAQHLGFGRSGCDDVRIGDAQHGRGRCNRHCLDGGKRCVGGGLARAEERGDECAQKAENPKARAPTRATTP